MNQSDGTGGDRAGGDYVNTSVRVSIVVIVMLLCMVIGDGQLLKKERRRTAAERTKKEELMRASEALIVRQQALHERFSRLETRVAADQAYMRHGTQRVSTPTTMETERTNVTISSPAVVEQVSAPASQQRSASACH